MDTGKKSSQWLMLGGLFVGLLTVVAHGRGRWGQFIEWDDPTHVTQNIAIRALTLEHWRMMFTTAIAKLYVPLTWLSLAVDYQIWGRDPYGYHLTNLILHVANTLLVLVLVRRLLAGRHPHPVGVAVLSAAIFGVHPLRVESVAWVTERKDVLFGFFYLLALGAYLRWAATKKRSAYWCCLAGFIAATLAKSTAVTLPAVLLLVDHYWARRSAWREKIPFLLVSLAVGAVTILAQAGGTGQTLSTVLAIPNWARVGLVSYCGLFYVQKFFWPLHLTAIYPTFDEMGWTPFASLTWTVVLVIVTGLLWVQRRRLPLLWSGGLFYLLTLAPTIGLLPAGIHVVADRFSYLPLLGLAVPVAAGLVWVSTRQWWMWLGVGGWLIALAFLTGQRTGEWHDTGTLFSAALRENPRCLPAHINLTLWYLRHQQLEEAMIHGRRAVEIAPAGLPGRKNLAIACRRAARYREAISVLRPAVEHAVDDPEVWQVLADCFDAVGEPANAAVARAHLADPPAVPPRS